MNGLALQKIKTDQMIQEEWSIFSITKCCPHCGNDAYQLEYKKPYKQDVSTWYFRCSAADCKKMWQKPIK